MISQSNRITLYAVAIFSSATVYIYSGHLNRAAEVLYRVFCG